MYTKHACDYFALGENFATINVGKTIHKDVIFTILIQSHFGSYFRVGDIFLNSNAKYFFIYTIITPYTNICSICDPSGEKGPSGGQLSKSIFSDTLVNKLLNDTFINFISS